MAHMVDSNSPAGNVAVTANGNHRKGAQTALSVPGEWGMWVLLLGDMMVFGAYFVCIALLRARNPVMFGASQHHLHPVMGMVNTLLLVTASLFVVRGLDAARRHRPGSRYFYMALGCAAGFAVIKALEYSLLVHDGYTLGTDQFFAYYFMFTGIHLAHLIIGVAVLWILAAVTRRHPLTAGRLKTVECGACFWHMVDLLWFVLFPLLYFL
ncbi:cytochrome C oxidase%2C subunit III family protein [Mycobacteroides abscessus]|nr:cytochrome C oxidase%2C subunit III family protein [Mycobacteroides abscessus]CPS45600.1 cytochrome C oxidase%2C subunit III family protein [Mycobacteroides abscessus]CPS54646.1 cytochrome C oxidase%2C subunit III family protein [Mycobacteroides abscessus]CPT37442.1 cytochrome C oxidase%2C subunit III family protein [Mycobacteroides abscessus]CPT64484.1 cytochrome C oxidase%2C subunit III family protein [Mycobacteroides abscessus]